MSTLLYLFLSVFIINFFIVFYTIYSFISLVLFKHKQGSKLKLKMDNH